MKNPAIPKSNKPQGGGRFKFFSLGDGEIIPRKYWKPSGKGDIYTSKFGTATGIAMVKPGKMTAVRQSVGGIWKLLNCT